MKDISMTFKETRNISIHPVKCPLNRKLCYESLGEYEKKCTLNNGFYIDTSSSLCKFDELSDSDKLIALKYAVNKE